MAEYIEREAAETCLCEERDKISRDVKDRYMNGCRDGLNVAHSLLIEIPDADVAPVRHGQWILKGRKILCSSCKSVFAEVEEHELFDVNADLPYLCEIEKYCFNCGAKMDGDTP